MRWVVRVKQLMLPPSGALILGFGGLTLAYWWPRLGLGLIALSLLTLYLLSAPWLVGPWLRRVDRYPRRDWRAADAPPAAAIAILDCGKMHATPERGGEMVTARTLQRLDEGARLHRTVGVPVLVTGYGHLLQQVLADSFGIEARWVESESSTTHENAQFSAELLRHDGVERVYLVTHFWHMRRSLAAFRHAGLEAIPVPAGRTATAPSERGLMGLAPSVRMLDSSYLLLHEWIGLWWYRLRYRYASSR
ncbi:MAG: YdcF family protein [Acidobacteriota bacterium]